MEKTRLSGLDTVFCDGLLRYGTIIEDHEFTLGGQNKRQYVIEYEGTKFYLTKTDGFWTYLHEVEKEETK